MKKFNASIFAMLLLAAVACTKSDFVRKPIVNANGNVSSDEAADMVAGSLSLNSSGVANIAGQVTISAASLATSHAACGTTRSDTINRQSAANASYTYSYNSTYNYIVNCDSTNHPASLSSNAAYSGSFSDANLSSNQSGSSVFTVNGLSTTATAYSISGEYKSSGSFKSKVDTTNAGSNSVDIVLKALTLLKPQRNITAGTATISVTGDVPKKGNFSYTGTLVFNANNTATLTLNGTVYTINLLTGLRSRL